jgi:hypothetical protein
LQAHLKIVLRQSAGTPNVICRTVAVNTGTEMAEFYNRFRDNAENIYTFLSGISATTELI